MERTLILVTGAGRSGTSTVAGTLSRLGVHVPGPYLQANESNPKGFYESKWSMEFHNRLLRRAAVGIADGRPDALARMRDAVRPRDRAELRDTLETLTDGHRLTALKDPRTAWTLALWRELADEVGITLASLTMVRHPAEVVGSRATHYAQGIDRMGETTFAVRNLAGWVNAMLITEVQTRGWSRSFVRYDDLLTDWRGALAGTLEAVGAEVPGPAPHPVDDFIDPDLSRHPLTWSDVDVLPGLEQVAEEVWSGCSRLAELGPDAEDVQAAHVLDAARERYDTMYAEALQLVHDATAGQIKIAKRAATRAARRKGAGATSSGVGTSLRAVARRVRGR